MIEKTRERETMKNKKLRACLLARVSTKNFSQESSIDNQIEQLSSLILSMEEFEFNPNEDIFVVFKK